MKKKQTGKRVAAWVLTAAMIVSSNSFAALAEETEALPAATEAVMEEVTETEAPAVETEAPATEAPAETEALAAETSAPAETEALAAETEAAETEALVTETEAAETEALTTETEEASDAPSEDATEAVQETAAENPEVGSETTGTETTESETAQEETQPTDAAEEEELILGDEEPVTEEKMPDLPQTINVDTNGKVPGTIDGVLTDGCTVDVSLESDEECKWYTFTPLQSGKYLVYSTYEGYSDPVMAVYKENTSDPGSLVEVAYSDDNGGDGNFRLIESYEANTVYYFKFREYDTYAAVYQVHLLTMPSAKSLTLKMPEGKTWVAGFHTMYDVLDKITAELTYADGTTYSYEDVLYGRDEYGARLTYKLPEGIEDLDICPSAGTYTMTVSADEYAVSATVDVTFVSMADAITVNATEGEQLSISGDDLAYVGFTPSVSDSYMFSYQNLNISSIFDVETQEEVPYRYAALYGTAYRADLEKGKTYLLIIYPYTYSEADTCVLTIECAKKIKEITFPNLKDNYGVLFAADALANLTANIVYDGVAEPEMISYWYTEDGYDDQKTYYYAYTQNGDRIELTLWNGSSQVDMPSLNLGTATGTFTLKATIGEKEWLSKQITIDPADSASLQKMTLNTNYSVTSDAEGNKSFSFTPDKTEAYNFVTTGLGSYSASIALYGNDNKQINRCYDCSRGFSCVLEAGNTYYYQVNAHNGSVSFQARIEVAKKTVLSVGSQQIPDLDGNNGGVWYSVTPSTSSVYECMTSTSGEEYDSAYFDVYDSNFERIDSGRIDWRGYLAAGNTYYINVMGYVYGADMTALLTLSQVATTKLVQDQSITISEDSWLCFTPAETGSYYFSGKGYTGWGCDIYCYDEKMNSMYSYYAEEDFSDGLYLTAGATYILRMMFYGEAFTPFTVTMSKGTAMKSLELDLEQANLFFKTGDHFEIGGDAVVTYLNGETDRFPFYNNEKRTLSGGYVLQTALYEADAYGNPDYDKKIEEDYDYDYYSEIKAGIYAFVAEIGYNVNGDFTRTSDVTPCIKTVIVTDVEHTAHNPKTITDKAATCGAAGSTISYCEVCGYKDPSTAKPIPATGKHTGGKATCTKKAVCSVCGQEYGALASHTGGTATCLKKAVCSVCGQEYGALAGHSYGAWSITSEATVFKKAVQTRTCSVCGQQESQETGALVPATIKLNANSLKMKTKQKTTKLTVTMGAGDSVASVKSSNTKVLKASVKKNKITLTAQKKTGKANLTIKLASGKSKTIKVTVQKNTVTTTKIKGVSKKLTLKKKQKVTLKPTLEPITSQDKIKYTTSNKKVATVSGKGVVTAKGKGKATITIKAGKKSFKCTITVK